MSIELNWWSNASLCRYFITRTFVGDFLLLRSRFANRLFEVCDVFLPFLSFVFRLTVDTQRLVCGQRWEPETEARPDVQWWWWWWWLSICKAHYAGRLYNARCMLSICMNEWSVLRCPADRTVMCKMYCLFIVSTVQAGRKFYYYYYYSLLRQYAANRTHRQSTRKDKTQYEILNTELRNELRLNRQKITTDNCKWIFQSSATLSRLTGTPCGLSSARRSVQVIA